VLWPEIQLLPETTVFDTEWVIGAVEERADWIANIARGAVDAAIPGIVQAVFAGVEPYLDRLAEDFYARRKE